MEHQGYANINEMDLGRYKGLLIESGLSLDLIESWPLAKLKFYGYIFEMSLNAEKVLAQFNPKSEIYKTLFDVFRRLELLTIDIAHDKHPERLIFNIKKLERLLEAEYFFKNLARLMGISLKH